ncbi:MAG TPA: phytanoyl-CoA dioxygenase family protein [Armatimonadota bacterium]|nr:phytanoyl-CoA dioxygenase family protein [Armatimonadota bacterium]
MTLTMGKHELELGGPYLGMLREANGLLHDPAALHARMEEDGYLLLRGLHDRAKVEAARRSILEGLDANAQLDQSRPLDEGVAEEGGRGAFLGGSRAFTRAEPFLNVVESPEIMGFFARFLRADVLTYDYKWLRVVGPGSFTGAHYDIVYMGRGTQNVYTAWTPLGDVPLEMGPLAVLVGSHRFERVRETYGRMDVDRDHVTGWFTNDPVEMVERFGGQWQTGEFRMGDVLIFGMYTMHGSLNNGTNRYRISCDTRYQRAHEPVDERWIGENPIAHYAWMEGETVPIEEARKKWGV